VGTLAARKSAARAAHLAAHGLILSLLIYLYGLPCIGCTPQHPTLQLLHFLPPLVPQVVAKPVKASLTVGMAVAAVAAHAWLVLAQARKRMGWRSMTAAALHPRPLVAPQANKDKQTCNTTTATTARLPPTRATTRAPDQERKDWWRCLTPSGVLQAMGPSPGEMTRALEGNDCGRVRCCAARSVERRSGRMMRGSHLLVSQLLVLVSQCRVGVSPCLASSPSPPPCAGPAPQGGAKKTHKGKRLLHKGCCSRARPWGRWASKAAETLLQTCDAYRCS
jgi:hypothetical protein